MKKSVVVTGVAGLIGSRLADWLVENKPEYEIVGIDNLSGGYRSNISDKVTFYELDCSSTEVKQVFQKHKPEYVFHLAAYAAEGLSPFIRKYNYQNNLLATASIINECIRHSVKG